MSFSTSAKRRRLRRVWPPPRTTGRSTIREKVLAKRRNGDVLGADVTDHRAAADDRDSGQLLLLGDSDSESGRSAGECVLKLEPACLAPAYAGVELDMTGVLVDDAIRQSTGRSLAQILMDAQMTRDLGLVAEQSKSSYRKMFRPAPSIEQV
uniref:DNA ligase 1 n=1 Tax=Culex pipiens TaxID=7175 RepID=A0A8D8NI95_CULPI